MNPVSRLTAGIETWQQIRKLGHDSTGKTFFEVGTGRAPITPLAYWLMGAKGTITIDLNPYVRPELVMEGLQYMADNRADMQRLFGPLLDQKRLDELLKLHRQAGFDIDAMLELCNIRYIAPGDAAQTGLPPGSIDFHTSFNVFEHIPPAILEKILAEGSRIIRDGGLFVHRIDYSDHFSHSDGSISPVNFLQYSDAEWDRYAGNRYMYMNRLRHDDFVNLFESAGQQILATEPTTHLPSRELLGSHSLKIDERFRMKSPEVLATTDAWIVSKKDD
ncbi:methyltransferase domain-containing protein [Rhodanobacter koreensis]